MKRRSRFKLKRFNTSRMLFSLAVCSFVLVGFSAVAYALAIPPALTDAWSVSAQSIQWSNTPSGNGEGAAGGSSASQGTSLSAEEAASSASDSADESSVTPGALAGIPAFVSTLQNDLDATVQETSNSLSQNASAGTSEGWGADASQSIPESSQMPDTGNEGGSASIEQPSGLSAEVEAAIHAHLLDCFSYLEPYYNDVCEGYSNLYASMNDPTKTHASCAPTDAYALLQTCDQGRIRVHSFRYNGEVVLPDSKWYDEAEKIATCFNDLTNACSVMRTVNGFLVTSAPGILRTHLNADGEVRYLAEFRDRYATIRL